MKIRGRFMIALSMIGIISCVVLPSANAEIFDIGEEMESDLKYAGPNYHPYTSGAIAYGSDFNMNLTSSIFDGNLSTGIEITNTTGSLTLRVYFPIPLFVTNITVKPYFGNGSSNYSLSVFLVDRVDGSIFLCSNANGERIFQMNCYIDSISLFIIRNGTDKYYFNYVLINYIPFYTNLTDVIASIDFLTNTINSLQNQINTLTQQNDMMNKTINELNQTQLEILENITELWSFYNQFNGSFVNILNEIANLNITTNENITLIKNDLTIIGTDIYNLYQSLENLTTNVTELSEIQYQIDITTQHINNLNENITEIKNTMPSEYDDTILVNQVFQLESENIALRNDIYNLSSEIRNLTLENTNLNNEIIHLEYENAVINNELINMTTEIEKLKELQEEPDNSIAIGAFIMGILGALIAIIAIIFASRKSGEQNLQTGKKEGEDNDPLKNVVNEEDSDT